MSEFTQFHIQRLGTLRSDRGNWNGQWEEAADRIIPAHRNSFQGPLANRAEGEKKTQLQFDATAGLAAQKFMSVIESIATPQGAVWERFKAIDPILQKNRAVKLFFEALAQTLHDYRYRPVANFVGNSQQVYLSLGVYGNGILFIDQPEKSRGLRYRNIHLGEAYFVENHANIVDTIYRVFPMTARQIVQKFNAQGDAVPQAMKDMAGNAAMMDKKHDVLHCVFPREDYDPQRVDPKGMPYASVYILVETQDLLRESGFGKFPYAVTRYTQASGETYGRGPGQWVLPSIKLLNEQKKGHIQQAHRTLQPVLLAHDDGNLGSFSMKAGALNPGGISKDGKRLIDVLPTGNLSINEKTMDMEKAIIHDAFLITLFQILIDTPQMTATEVLERAKEKGMLLAPTSGRMSSEFLGPMIEREIQLLGVQGLLPKMPQILIDYQVEYRIEYDNPLSRMARSEKASGFMRALDTAGNYAKMTGDMEPLDWFDFDTAMPEILDIQGAPTSWTRTLEDVQARRSSRSQNAQTQQMVDAAPAMASVAKQIGGKQLGGKPA